MKIIKQCLQCKKEFKSWKSQKRKFCSPSCASIYNNSHGGGFSGKKRNEEFKLKTKLRMLFNNPMKKEKYRKKISKKLKGRSNTWTFKLKGQKRPNTSLSILKAYKEGRLKPNRYRNGGYRKDLKQYFRSSWEANYARYLNYLKIKWIYEPQVFILIINNKEVTYRPDFYLIKNREYIEVKGFWFNDLAKKKYELFSLIYKSKLIDEIKYFKIRKEYRDKIQNWEN